MPGDPKRAEYIAKNYLEDYKLVNEVRGMLAFTGKYKGKKVTVMASGMGMPSMGIYSYELFKEYDVKNIIKDGMRKGELVEGDSSVIASGIFGFTCSTMVYKLRHQEKIEIQKIYKEIEKDFIVKLEK